MELKTIGPLFIGSGISIGKKEYIYNPDKGLVLVPDVTAMYIGLQKLRLERKYQEYLLAGNTGMDLGKWLFENKVKPVTYNPWIRYTLLGGDHLRSGKRPVAIDCFTKDSYGLPYVPGSSIKGTLRTILLAYELIQNPQKYQDIGRDIPGNAERAKPGKKVLHPDVQKLEESVFHTLNRKTPWGKPVPTKDAVNDCLSGLIISDSEPLPLKSLTLCQKLDRSVDGNYNNSINTLRESIKPGTPIHFQLTIDETLCRYTIEDIRQAVQKFGEAYYSLFLSSFKGTDRPGEDTVWLGGGAGFFTKTVLYPLLGKEKGLTTAVTIFDKTLSPKAKREHKHDLDIKKGVSPHMIKFTEYEGKTYQIGMCKLSVLKENVL